MSGVPLHSIRDMWDNNLTRFPHKVAAIDNGRPMTFGEADCVSRILASYLYRECGVRKGDRVAIAMPNCSAYFIAYWATVRLGAVVVPVNIRLLTEEMAHVIHNSDAGVLFIHADCRQAVEKALPHCPRVRHRISVGYATDDAAAWDAVLGAADNAVLPDIALDEDDLAIIMHTSGTTGRPKGAMMRHRDLIFNVRMAIIAQSFRHEDVHLLVVPMFHATALYSMLPSCAYLGSSVVFAPKQNIPELVELIETHRCTTFFGVPTLFHFLANYKDLGDHDLSSLRLIAYAGSVMPPVTIRRLRERLPHVELHNFFGLTETIAMTHVLPSADALTHAESIGKPLPEIGQQIIDEQGNVVAPGEVGELCFAAGNVICGYWKEPERLAESMTGGWFRTGDLASMDEDGYVFIKGRRKEMIIVGGENVYALEVENTIMQYGDVLEVAVVGVEATGARAYLGELVKAVVVPRPGAQVRDLDIKRFCTERLASYKVPQIVEFREALPRNASGKVLKRELI